MRTGLTKQEKTTDIWFDEKEPLIYIRTHNTDLKNRLTAYAAAHTGECRQTDADQDTGCMEFEIRKGRFSFRLTAPAQNAAGRQARRRKSAAFMEKLQLRATQQIERFLLGWYNISTLKLARCKLHLTRPN